ncbi:conserved hypothetical protein [Candidatus Desulfosporosinus infrequens]|uniref:Carboxypeptidase regulatory-like domain-containing protein n=1 Tax=Candidatus Desulfosporosinus infrequens TaxID=2043169 RepID=A0A2U3K820_9FIRM|nr:conserved hypothetical protein [Candidatus Desulfosporosinus infrequens]
MPNTTKPDTSSIANTTKPDTVTDNVVFSVSTPLPSGQPGETPGVPLPGVTILVIGEDGKVISKLITNDQGEVQKDITAPVDPKYPETSSYYTSMPRGTVTVIAFKDGYRPVVLYEVPVSKASAAQSFVMMPNVDGDRNEPDVQVGNNHHMEVLGLVDKYQAILDSGKFN